MRFERLDLNLLVALQMLLEERNVSAAARRVNLSQSAMSNALNRLREYFEDPLLIPAGRGMKLTKRSEQLIEPVNEALEFIKTNITCLPEFDPNTAVRNFKIFAADYVAETLLVNVAKEISGTAPGLTMELVLPSEEMYVGLERGEVDLIIVPERLLFKHHPSRKLFHEDHVVVAWNENSKISGEITRDLYFSLFHVVVRFGSTWTPNFVGDFVGEILKKQKGKRRINVIVPYFGMIPKMILGTDRIATMLRRQAETLAETMPIKIYPAPVPLPGVSVAMQWHAGNDADQGLRWLVDRIQAFAERDWPDRAGDR